MFIYFRQCRSNVRLARGERKRASRRCIPYGDYKPESAIDNQTSERKVIIAVRGRIPHCVWRLPTVLSFFWKGIRMRKVEMYLATVCLSEVAGPPAPAEP